MKGDTLNAIDKTKCQEHLKVFEEVKQLYDETEDDPSNKVMEKMMTLYEHGQPPAEFMEFIEPELRKMEEDPNNPIFAMMRDMMPNGQQGNQINNNPNMPNMNPEETPPECKNN